MLFMKLVEIGDAPEGDLGADCVQPPAVQWSDADCVAPDLLVDPVHRAAERQRARLARERIIGIERAEQRALLALYRFDLAQSHPDHPQPEAARPRAPRGGETRAQRIECREND